MGDWLSEVGGWLSVGEWLFEECVWLVECGWVAG